MRFIHLRNILINTNPVFLTFSNMSTFVSKVNVLTGKMEWDFRDDDYDYKQEIARSAYADMLHDTERNQLYYKALEKGIARLRKENRPVHVLDIGTGTGLLSMMAARLGADTVTACEAFKPMAECAKKIIKENGFESKITLVPKRSTELMVGQGKDMPQRASLLVTEVFDTELIGEGAIGTFTHAHRELLEKDCVVVPAVGNMYVQIVNSDLVRRWNQIQDIEIEGCDGVTSPTKIAYCGGAPALHDLQLDQMPLETFTRLTDPVRVFRFDFTGKTPLPYDNSSVVECVAQGVGTVDGVFMWWDLEMDEQGEIILSCAPRWAHPTPDNMQWRDHWMQAIYYPYSQLSVAIGDRFKVISKHDEYSLWFDVAGEFCKDTCPEERPICRCGAHVTYSRSRLGMMSDSGRWNTYLSLLNKYIRPGSICLCISDGSLLPMVAARLGAGHVYTVETNPMCQRVTEDFIKHNNLQDKITVLEKMPDELTEDTIRDKVDVLLGEPWFLTSMLPWDNMCYWYTAQTLTQHLAPGATLLPTGLTVYAVAVEFKDLWKIRADVGMCEGFNLGQFDKLIQATSEQVDEAVEPQPLWEYPCRAAGPAVRLLEVDITRPVSDTKPVDRPVVLTVDSTQPCNGVALWADFQFDKDHVISTGPSQPIRTGKQITWDYYMRQGVHLFYNNRKLAASSSPDLSVSVNVKFLPSAGELTFKFKPSWSS